MARTRPTRAQNLAIKQRRFEKNYANNHGLAKTSARDYTKKYKKQDLAETEATKRTIHIKYIKDGICKCEKMDTRQNSASKKRRSEKTYTTNHGLVKTLARDYT